MSPREFASHEVQMRQVWNMRQRPALMYVTPDFDGGDDASTLTTALEKGGVFGDAYHKFSSTFLSAFGSTFEKERLWKRKGKKPHRRPRPCRCAGPRRRDRERRAAPPQQAHGSQKEGETATAEGRRSCRKRRGLEVPTAFIHFRGTRRTSRASTDVPGLLEGDEAPVRAWLLGVGPRARWPSGRVSLADVRQRVVNAFHQLGNASFRCGATTKTSRTAEDGITNEVARVAASSSTL